MLAAIKRVKCEREMCDQRAVKRRGRKRIAPESHEPRAPGFHGIEGDQPQGVVGKVGDQVDQQHETRGKPYAANGHDSMVNLSDYSCGCATGNRAAPRGGAM